MTFTIAAQKSSPLPVEVTSRWMVEFLDTVRVSGSDHAVMSSGLATSSSKLLGPVMSSMECSER